MIASACFVDSWAFQALTNQRDQWHEVARATERALQLAQVRLVTTNVVIYETLTGIRNEAGHRAAVDFGRWVETSGRADGLEVVWVTRELHDAAWRLFERYDDKTFSFVDCLSFALMHERGIHHAFTGDRHFQQMGFITVPRLDGEGETR